MHVHTATGPPYTAHGSPGPDTQWCPAASQSQTHSRCSRRDLGPDIVCAHSPTHSRCSQKLKAWSEVSAQQPHSQRTTRQDVFPKERDRGLTCCRKSGLNKGPGGGRGASRGWRGGCRVSGSQPGRLTPWTAVASPSLESGVGPGAGRGRHSLFQLPWPGRGCWA